MKNKNNLSMTLKEALAWTETHAMLNDVRKRMASRQVAWLFYNALRESSEYIHKLERVITEGSKVIESQEEEINFLRTKLKENSSLSGNIKEILAKD